MVKCVITFEDKSHWFKAVFLVEVLPYASRNTSTTFNVQAVSKLTQLVNWHPAFHAQLRKHSSPQNLEDSIIIFRVTEM